MRSDMRGKEPSIKEGQVFTGKCIGIGKKGDGVFKPEGFVVIVPDTEVNLTYTVEVLKVVENVAFGQVIED